MNKNTYSIRVYVPKAVDSATKQEVKEYLAERTGGFTAYNAEGGWINDIGDLIQEDVSVIEAVTETVQPANIAKNAARIVKNHSNEDAVMWDIKPMRAKRME